FGGGGGLPVSGGPSTRAKPFGARSPRTGGDREVEPADGARTVRCHRTHGSKYQSDLSRPFQAIPGLRRSSAYGRSSAPGTDGSRAERTPVRRGGPLHNRRHHGVGGNRYRGPFGRHKNISGARVFDPLARASVEPSKRQGVTLRQLEEENSKLRKIVADLSLDKGISGRICLRSAKDAKDAESFERAHTRSRRSTTRRH